MVSSDEISSHTTIIMNTSLSPDCGLIFSENWKLKEHKRVSHDERVLNAKFVMLKLLA